MRREFRREADTEDSAALLASLKSQYGRGIGGKLIAARKETRKL
jgi:hypothetical protein